MLGEMASAFPFFRVLCPDLSYKKRDYPIFSKFTFDTLIAVLHQSAFIFLIFAYTKS